MDNCSCSFCQKGDTDYCFKKIKLNNSDINAITYYEKAHDEGNPLACVCLGLIYYYSYVMTDDSICYEKALYWYKISLDNDTIKDNNTINIAACIAELYFDKYNTNKDLDDLELCINWYEQAILKETEDVGYNMYSLGMLYIKTINPPNYDLAMEYFVKAVDKGYWRSAAKLACMYFRGIGVKQNYKTSDEWKDKAVAIINDTYPDADSREFYQRRIYCIARDTRLYIS
jgi:TPR repeat protein